jgi:hypothetical protein
MDFTRASEIYAEHFAGREAVFTGAYKLCFEYELKVGECRLALGLGGSGEDCRQTFGPTRKLAPDLAQMQDDAMSVDIYEGQERYSHFNVPW